MGIKVTQSGDWKKTETFLLKNKQGFNDEQIEYIAKKSLEKFKKNTPKSSGLTANSWSYVIIKKGDKRSIEFHNSNIQNGYNIALLVDTGHATNGGKWVSGEPYIDKTVKEIYDKILNDAWEELNKYEK